MTLRCPYCGKDLSATPPLGDRYFCIACGALSFAAPQLVDGLRRATRAERSQLLGDPDAMAARRTHLQRNVAAWRRDKRGRARAG